MFEEKYEPHEIEARWQKYWADHKTYKVERTMIPGPNPMCWKCSPIRPVICTWGMCGTYSIGDVVARFRTMRGFNVLHPIGFDSFGMLS